MATPSYTLLLASLGLLSPSAWAAGLCPQQPIRLAFYESGLFYYEGKGVDVDLVKELRRRSGCKFELSVLPRMRAYTLLENGQIDIVMAAVENPQRNTYAYFTPYLQQRFAAVIPRSVPASKTSLAAFTADPSLHFGMVRGVSYGVPRDKWTSQMTAAGRVQIAPTPAIAYRMLQGGRFSALFAIPMQYEKELKDRGLRDQMTIIDWFPQEPPTTRNLALSRKRFTTEQLAAWNALVKTLRSDGTMQAVLQRYLTPAEAAKAMPK